MDVKVTSPKYGKYVEKENSKLFKCPSCSTVVLASKLIEQRHLKIMFKVSSEARYVTMNSKILQEYFLFWELEMSQAIDEISKSIWNNENTVIVADNRNVVINFED